MARIVCSVFETPFSNKKIPILIYKHQTNKYKAGEVRALLIVHTFKNDFELHKTY